MTNQSCLKTVCSVSELAQSLELSRGRFYQLIERGPFPPPIYDLKTKRPYYTLELQQICHEVRSTNIGYDGRPILFYTPRRKKEISESPSFSAEKRKKAASNPQYQELADALANIGIQSLSPQQIQDALNVLFPGQKVETLDHGLVIRQLFRHFKTRV
ncbi:MAG: hypothetical protein GX629_02415 [Phycisphaerae bacterium]|nr:hypothetical protein [Phycisphaerae bacterium]